MIPLHWRTGAGTVIAAFFGWHSVHVTHTDLISVIDERAARHGQKECKCNLHVLLVEQVMHTLHIVVA